MQDLFLIFAGQPVNSCFDIERIKWEASTVGVGSGAENVFCGWGEYIMRAEIRRGIIFLIGKMAFMIWFKIRNMFQFQKNYYGI